MTSNSKNTPGTKSSNVYCEYIIVFVTFSAVGIILLRLPLDAHICCILL